MKKLAILMIVSAVTLMAQAPLHQYEVTITNITRSQIFSPPVAVLHGRGYVLFELGKPAPTSVSLLAEDGMNGDVMMEAEGHDHVNGVAAADGVLMPGESVTLIVESPYRGNLLTVLGMLVTTNDAFFALNGAETPVAYFNRGGTMTMMAEAYDAGTEANNEDCAFIPGPPCGNPGVRATEDAEGFVYIHPGIHGEGDISRTYDWRSKVAKVKVKVLR